MVRIYTPNSWRLRTLSLRTAVLQGVRACEIGYYSEALPGQDNAILTEPTPSHAKCLETRLCLVILLWVNYDFYLSVVIIVGIVKKFYS